jgi:ribosomal protein S18 acetylase RimI-like enzyme
LLSPLTEPKLSQAALEDVAAICQLYVDVAKVPGGLARLESEIDSDYVERFVTNSCAAGLILVAESNGQLLGEIHGYKSGLFCFGHVLSELTIAVAPAAQGQGIGRILFRGFIDQVGLNMPEVLRVELIARESNHRAIAFYESLGSQQEGCFYHRIRNVDGTLESDIPMAWCRGEAE